MRPTRIDGCNGRAVAPAGVDAANLPIRRTSIAGVSYCVSAWEAEDVELGWMAAGGHVQLAVSCAVNAHPLIRLTVAEPPPDGPPALMCRQINQPNGSAAVRVDVYSPANEQHGMLRAFSLVELEGDDFDGAAALAIRVAMNELRAAILKRSSDSG